MVLIVLLAVTVYMVYRPSETVERTKPYGLRAILGPVQGYRLIGNTLLDEKVSTFLDLDDYTQSSYQGTDHQIGLYIGYYYSLEKVSAAHSPLVCFPGQGWKLEQKTNRHLQVGSHKIKYAEMIAESGGYRQLVMYWYQAHEKTEPEIYRNKINAVFNKVTGIKGEHAFVRVTVPILEGGEKRAGEYGRSFIKAFYPSFLDYINSSRY